MWQIERGNYDKAQVLKQNVNRHVNYLPYAMHLMIAENILKTAVKPVKFLRTFSHLRNFRRCFNNFKSLFSCPHHITHWPVTITASSPRCYMEQEITDFDFNSVYVPTLEYLQVTTVNIGNAAMLFCLQFHLFTNRIGVTPPELKRPWALQLKSGSCYSQDLPWQFHWCLHGWAAQENSLRTGQASAVSFIPSLVGVPRKE